MNRLLFLVAHTLRLTSITTIASAQRFHHHHWTQPHHWHHHSSAAKSLKSSQNTLAPRSASVKFVRHCKSYVHQSFSPPLFSLLEAALSWIHGDKLTYFRHPTSLFCRKHWTTAKRPTTTRKSTASLRTPRTRRTRSSRSCSPSTIHVLGLRRLRPGNMPIFW